MAIFLINKDINLNLQDNEGFTVLHLCYKFNYFEIIQLLTEKGINLNIKDKYGKNALYYQKKKK